MGKKRKSFSFFPFFYHNYRQQFELIRNSLCSSVFEYPARLEWGSAQHLILFLVARVQHRLESPFTSFFRYFFNEGISSELTVGGSAALNWHGFGWDSERRFDSPPVAIVFSFKYLLCYNRSRSRLGRKDLRNAKKNEERMKVRLGTNRITYANLFLS